MLCHISGRCRRWIMWFFFRHDPLVLSQLCITFLILIYRIMCRINNLYIRHIFQIFQFCLLSFDKYFGTQSIILFHNDNGKVANNSRLFTNNYICSEFGTLVTDVIQLQEIDGCGIQNQVFFENWHLWNMYQ